MKNWQKLVIPEKAKLKFALEKIDELASGCIFLSDNHNRLVGVLTDGDIRRSLLNGAALENLCSEYMNTEPKYIRDHSKLDDIGLHKNNPDLNYVPVIGNSGQINEILDKQEISNFQLNKNTIVVMAGGKGKRLLPLTKNCPKPMLPLNDKPILEHIIENFRSQGFRNFVISVNHLKNQIEEYFGDGTALGCSIDYVRESKPLGTAGSISLIDKNKVEFPIIISNGDLLTKMSFGDLLNFHLDQKSDATMATRKYEIQIPFGVVSTQNNRISGLVEKPVSSLDVNAGIYVISEDAFNLVEKGTHLDMTSLFNKFISKKMVVSSYSIKDYWIDIGRPEELLKANIDWDKK